MNDTIIEYGELGPLDDITNPITEFFYGKPQDNISEKIVRIETDNTTGDADSSIG